MLKSSQTEQEDLWEHLILSSQGMPKTKNTLHNSMTKLMWGEKANVRQGCMKHHDFILELMWVAVDSQATLNNEKQFLNYIINNDRISF